MTHSKTGIWQAEWIWHGKESAPYHHFLFLRKTFQIAEKSASATLRITATDRYRLFVNGAYLGRGPERCDPRWQSYDSYDLQDKLSDGKNCIAVQAYFYGCSTGFTRDGRPGFLAELEVERAGTAPLVIPTDETWMAQPARGWNRDAKTVGIGTGVTEVLDARLDAPDWLLPDFDDSGWDRAAVIPPNAGQWCSNPEPRHIPFLEEREVFPERVLRTGEVLALDDTIARVDIAELMATDIHQDLSHARIENIEAVLSDGESSAVIAQSPHTVNDDVSEGIYDPYVLLDFGRQINAFPRIFLEASAGVIVDVAYGEELIAGRIVPLICATRCADRYITREGPQLWEAFEYKSFRYLQVTIRNTDSPVQLRSVSANIWRYPAEIKGSFSCSDETLSKLWTACAVTSDLCTDDAFMDSPLREKRNWLGDGSHILLGFWAAFGDLPIIKRYFELAKQGAFGDGMLRMFFPGSEFYDEKTKFVSTIPQHAFVWAARVKEYYLYFGDITFLEGMYPTLAGLAAWAVRHENADGLLHRLPGWNWLDWSPADLRGANFGINAFYLHLLDDLEFIAGAVGLREQADNWRQRSARLRAVLQEKYWDEKRGVFLDSIFRGRPTGVASELGNGLALLFGIAEPKQADRIVSSITEGGRNLVRATPLFFHYVPQGIAAAGHGAEALELIRRSYEPMMKVSQTLWEGWQLHAMMPQITENRPNVPAVIPEGRTETVLGSYHPAAVALAHCAGVGAAFLLLTDIIGIKPADAGFKGCVLQPLLHALDEAEGSFPTNKGNITVSWKPAENAGNGQTSNAKTVNIELPPDVPGKLRIERSRLTELPDGAQIEGEWMIINLSPGKHILEIKQ